MLTIHEREKLREKIALLSPQGIEQLARQCQLANRPDAALFIRNEAQQLAMRARAERVPLEIVGADRQRQDTKPTRPPAPAAPPLINRSAIAFGAKVAVGLGAAGAITGLVIIPAGIALANAAVTGIVVVAPWAAGGLLALIVIRAAFWGEKKTEQQRERGSGNTYNVYIGENQNVRVFSEKSGQQ